MKVATKRIKIDRKTGEKIKEEILETQEVDEDEYFRPLVEIYGRNFIKNFKGEMVMFNPWESMVGIYLSFIFIVLSLIIGFMALYCLINEQAPASKQRA